MRCLVLYEIGIHLHLHQSAPAFQVGTTGDATRKMDQMPCRRSSIAGAAGHDNARWRHVSWPATVIIYIYIPALRHPKPTQTNHTSFLDSLVFMCATTCSSHGEPLTRLMDLDNVRIRNAPRLGTHEEPGRGQYVPLIVGTNCRRQSCSTLVKGRPDLRGKGRLDLFTGISKTLGSRYKHHITLRRSLTL